MIDLNIDQGILRDGKMYCSELPHIFFIKCPKEQFCPFSKPRQNTGGGGVGELE